MLEFVVLDAVTESRRGRVMAPDIEAARRVASRVHGGGTVVMSRASWELHATEKLLEARRESRPQSAYVARPWFVNRNRSPKGAA